MPLLKLMLMKYIDICLEQVLEVSSDEDQEKDDGNENTQLRVRKYFSISYSIF